MQRGSNVTLTREIPGLKGIVVGVRWNAGSEKPLDDNLVAAAILCGHDNLAISDEHFVFFNQLTSPDMSVTQLAAAVGDDQEQIEIDLTTVPPAIERIVVVLYVNEGVGARRTLGQLKSCSVRLLNLADNAELVRSEDFRAMLGSETAISMAEVYRHNGDWKFKVLGQSYPTGFAGIAADYGLSR